MNDSYGEAEGSTDQTGQGPAAQDTADQTAQRSEDSVDEASGQGESRDDGQAQQAQNTASGATGGGQQDNETSGESDDNSENYSYSDSDSTTTTMEEKGNEGLLGGLLGLNLLPSPETYTRTVESGDSESSSDSGEGSESGGEQADSNEG